MMNDSLTTVDSLLLPLQTNMERKHQLRDDGCDVMGVNYYPSDILCANCPLFCHASCHQAVIMSCRCHESAHCNVTLFCLVSLALCSFLSAN